VNLYQVAFEIEDLGVPAEGGFLVVYGQDEPFALGQAEACVNTMVESLGNPQLKAKLKTIMQLPPGTIMVDVGMLAVSGVEPNSLSVKVIDESVSQGVN
jgi:hypothetical protein